MYSISEMKGVKEFYNATANEWADKWYKDETMLPLLEKFVGLFETRPRILDAGCGAGYESMRLSNLNADVLGIDISEESIKIARQKNPACQFEILDCKQLDKRFGIFDGIAAIALLVHMHDSELRLILCNFKKVIKTNGYLFVCFVEGNGFSDKRSYVEVKGEKYNRAFYLHQRTRIIDAAALEGFQYADEWFLPNPIGDWKYLLFQAQ